MRKDELFFEARKDWSRRKHLVLRHYVESAAGKLRAARNAELIRVVDAFAGAGQYDNGDPGSPLEMASVAQKCNSWNSQVKVEIINFEIHKKRFEKLCAVTDEYTKSGAVRNINCDFSDFCSNYDSFLSNFPSVIIVDPFKQDESPFVDLAKLLRRPHLTEFFIVFHSLNVYRMICTLRESSHADLSSRIGTEETLDIVFGDREWTTLVREETSVEDVLALYCDKLKREYDSVRRKTWSPATKISVKSNKGLKYHLIGLTSHVHGLILMNDAFFSQMKDIYEQEMSVTSQGLFFEEDEFANKIEDKDYRKRKIIEEIQSFSKELPDITLYENLIGLSVEKNIGKYRESEHINAIRELIMNKTGFRIEMVDGIEMTPRGNPKLERMTRLRIIQG